MFSHGDIGVMAWMLLIFGPVLIVLALYFSLRAREFSWPNIAVLGIALAVLLVPSVQRLSIGKDAVSLELFQNSVEPARDALAALQKANEDNRRALVALQDSVSQISIQYAELLAKQTSAIAALGAGAQAPAATGTAPQTPSVTGMQQDLSRIQTGLTTSLNQAQQSINAAAPNNEIARIKIRDIDSALRMAK
jgi:hypothetical protein